MIHVLGWAAVTLTAAHSYQRRPFPQGKDHRAELPALAYAMVMVLVLSVLIGLTHESTPVELPAPRVVWVPYA